MTVTHPHVSPTRTLVIPLAQQGASDFNFSSGTHTEFSVSCECAGRAAEELVYGPDEMSTMNQRRLVMARRIVQKLVRAAITLRSQPSKRLSIPASACH